MEGGRGSLGPNASGGREAELGHGSTSWVLREKKRLRVAATGVWERKTPLSRRRKAPRVLNLINDS